jgi:hypothetical protein
MVTAREPGAKLVFTQGLLRKPFAAALRASRAAATITPGSEVLVQEVMAAMSTAPCVRLQDWPLRSSVALAA